jgi:hypothetical protein
LPGPDDAIHAADAARDRAVSLRLLQRPQARRSDGGDVPHLATAGLADPRDPGRPLGRHRLAYFPGEQESAWSSAPPVMSTSGGHSGWSLIPASMRKPVREVEQAGRWLWSMYGQRLGAYAQIMTTPASEPGVTLVLQP